MRNYILRLALLQALLATADNLPYVGTAYAKCTSTPMYNGSPRPDNNVYYQTGRSVLASTSGTKADILNYSPWVQPNGAGETHVGVAWVMVDSNSQGTNPGWAQAGWWEVPGGSRWTFTQTYDPVTMPGPSHMYTGFFSPQPVGSYTNYKVVQAYSSNQLFVYYYVNSGFIEQEPVQFGVYRSTADSEINTLASQMPGGYSSNSVHEVFSNANVLVNGTWQAMGGSNVNYNPTYFGVTSTSSTYHMTWDKACAT